MDNQIILSAKNINKNFGDTSVLSNINIDIKKGELVSIMGRSGSGKSTLLNILIGQIMPSSGDVFLNNVNINRLKDKELSRIRLREIGFINQDALLFEEFNIIENIQLPLLIAGELNKKNKEKVKKYMLDLDILSLEKKKVHELSGGEKQRVSIVRALSMEPSLLIADEPTGNLDDETKIQFMNLIKNIHKEFTLTTVLVTHDHKVSAMCDKTYNIINKNIN